MSRVPRNLLWAFENGRELGTAGGPVRVEVRQVGRLVLPTGRLIACDPGFRADIEPLGRPCPPGAYPVEVCIAHIAGVEQRIAAARVRLGDAPATRLEWTDPGYYQSGTGNGCFMDQAVVSVINAMSEGAYGDFIGRLAEQAAQMFKPTRSWSQLLVDAASGGNVVSFTSGYGSGIYPSFYGHDDDGEIVQIVTDFCMLDTSEELRSAIQAEPPPPVADSPPKLGRALKPWWRFWGRR